MSTLLITLTENCNENTRISLYETKIKTRFLKNYKIKPSHDTMFYK